MAIVFTNQGASAAPDFADNSNAASYASDSWTPPTSGIIFLWVISRRGGGPDAPTVTGNGLTWTQIGSTLDVGTNDTGESLFIADAAGASTGATTIDFGANTQLGCMAEFGSATGVDISGGIAAAVVQQPTNTGTATSGSLTFAAAGNAANRMIAAYYHSTNEVTSPDAAWTEMDDLQMGGPASGFESQFKTDATTTSGTASWATSDAWGGMGAELKAILAGVGGVFPNPIRHPMRDLSRRL